MLFQVWQRDFGGRLRVRSESQHKKCSQCIKHKLIISKLNNNHKAQKAQMQLYQAHLDRQYKDRMSYWERRTQSRLCAQSLPSDLQTPTLCCILDSMDCSKHAFPRSPALASKDFGNFIRPRLTHTSIIVHGRRLSCVLSPPHLPANSSRTVDIIANTLTRISRAGTDLRRFHVNIQGDNCCRELKNQSTMRMAALMASNHLVHSSSVTFLESGHSHEDIDAFFSNVSEYLNGVTEIETADGFVQRVQNFLDRPGTRPTEPVKEAFMLQKCHNWRLGLGSLLALHPPPSLHVMLEVMPLCRCRRDYLADHLRACHLKGIGGPGAPHHFQFDRKSDLMAKGEVPTLSP